MRCAALVADGQPVPKMTRGRSALLILLALSLSPLLGAALHLPTVAVGFIALQMVAGIVLARMQGAMLGAHRFYALGINQALEGVARAGLGVWLGITWGLDGLALAMFASTVVAIVTLPPQPPIATTYERPATSLFHSSLALALLGVFVQLDLLLVPSAFTTAQATQYDLAAVPSKAVYLGLAAARSDSLSLCPPSQLAKVGGRRLRRDPGPRPGGISRTRTPEADYRGHSRSAGGNGRKYGFVVRRDGSGRSDRDDHQLRHRTRGGATLASHRGWDGRPHRVLEDRGSHIVRNLRSGHSTTRRPGKPLDSRSRQGRRTGAIPIHSLGFPTPAQESEAFDRYGSGLDVRVPPLLRVSRGRHLPAEPGTKFGCLCIDIELLHSEFPIARTPIVP